MNPLRSAKRSNSCSVPSRAIGPSPPPPWNMKRSGAPGLRSRGIYRTKDRGLPSIIPLLTEKLPVVSGGAAMAEDRKLVVANTARAVARVIPSQPHIGDEFIAFPPRNFGE